MSQPEKSMRYHAVHGWVRRTFGKASKCETCGATARVHWSNKFHTYQRKREDWQQLCPKCHYEFDKNLPPAPKEIHKTIDRTKLTAIQTRVLGFLGANGSASFQEAARKLKVSKGTIQMAIKALEKKKYLTRYLPVWIVLKKP